MSKGIIYLMTTIVPGLVKIGKTGSGNFEQRMYNLEHDGYRNVTGLKRAFAIEVEEYDDKETMLDNIFEKSRVADTELFALDVKIAKQLLSSLDGTVIYPKSETKEDIFTSTTSSFIPDGEYYLNRKTKRWDKPIIGTMKVKNGEITVLKGSVCCPVIQNPKDIALSGTTTKRSQVKIVDNIIQEDVKFNSVSMAAQFLTYAVENGWLDWKTVDGKAIDAFRKQ